MSRTVVTLIGKDHVGIIASVCNYFAENGINILDIKQTTIKEYINMVLIVDTSEYKGTFAELNTGLEKVGADVGCLIRAVHEDIFEMMHRI